MVLAHDIGRRDSDQLQRQPVNIGMNGSFPGSESIYPDGLKPEYNGRFFYFFNFVKLISSAGNKTRLAMVAATKVREVNQPRACVPPKLLKQKITKPAISTIEV